MSQNVTNCKKEPYQHCQDVLREVCRDSLGEECRDKLHEVRTSLWRSVCVHSLITAYHDVELFIKECQTRFKEEMSNTKVRECNEECLQEPK